MAVNTWTAGTTTGAVMATEFNKVANALNSIGNYSCASSQGISGTATAPTPIPFDSNDYQTGILTHSGTTNNTRFTVSSACDVVFTAQLQVKHLTTGTGTLTAWFRKNGTTAINNSAAIITMNGVANTDVLTLQCIIPMLATDYVELLALASAASEWNVQTTGTTGTSPNIVPVTPGVIMTAIVLPA